MFFLPWVSQTMQHSYNVYVCFFLNNEEHIFCYSLGLHGVFFVVAEEKVFWNITGKSFLKNTETFISKRIFLLPQWCVAILQS